MFLIVRKYTVKRGNEREREHHGYQSETVSLRRIKFVLEGGAYLVSL